MMQATDLPQLETSWQKILAEEMQKPYFADLLSFVDKERDGFNVYPSKELVFNAFSSTPYEKVKVVIVGQDPYHGAGQAHGLSFSVPKGITPPPSLVNIYKEIERDLKIVRPEHGCLTAWAEQGVLLLNASLTVREASPMSHHGKGWEIFTDAVITLLAQKKEPTVFVLWGNSAQKKCKFLLQDVPRGTRELVKNNHLILMAPHPSPLSCYQGFLGCGHFSRINTFLKSHSQPEINWSLK